MLELRLTSHLPLSLMVWCRNLLESLYQNAPNCVLYQASTSELFGGSKGQAPQDVSTPFDPRSPYATAKQMAYYSALNYSEWVNCVL